MILTRSIRRKLAIVVALVFAMVVLLSIAGLSTLFAYRELVGKLQISHDKELRHDNLAIAVSGLIETLVRVPNLPPDENPFIKQISSLEVWFDDTAWTDQRGVVQKELTEYIRKLHDPAPSVASRIPDLLKYRNLEHFQARLDLLDRQRFELLKANPYDQHELAKNMLMDAAMLQPLVQRIRTPDSVVDNTLRDSDRTINRLFWLIGVPTLTAIALFGGLIYFCYHWILIPVRQLHEAASRVASGDYTYRLKLKGKDEMAELGDMFNKMTARFQTDKSKLAQEVEDRSRQLIRNERLAGIGFLASGIAHEINNPLQAIANAAESLNSRLGDSSLGSTLPSDERELLTTYLQMIERESTRCQQITARVLDFARGTNGPKSRHDMTKIVTEVLDMVSHMSKFDNRKILFDRARPHYAEVNPAEMKQVILNLVANGLEAMKSDGTMTIQLHDLVDEVVLSVQDDGCGMTPNVLENLYEPFFTEKQNGKGTGLGLSITNRIVGDHGGHIEASSDGPGCGSTFRVYLPRCAKASRISAA